MSALFPDSHYRLAAVDSEGTALVFELSEPGRVLLVGLHQELGQARKVTSDGILRFLTDETELCGIPLGQLLFGTVEQLRAGVDRVLADRERGSGVFARRRLPEDEFHSDDISHSGRHRLVETYA